MRYEETSGAVSGSTTTGDGATEQAKARAQGAASTAQDKAQQAAGQAQEKAQEVAGQARGQLRQQVDQRSTQAGEQVTSVAQDVRTVSGTLREQGKDRPAQWAEQIAGRVESLGDYLKRADGDRILNDVENFGRRQPWGVVGGGLLVGFLASRFLKASSSRRYQESYGGGGYQRVPVERRVPAVTSPVTSPVTAPPVDRTDDLLEPRPASGAERVSLSGGVLPGEEPPLTGPGRTS